MAPAVVNANFQSKQARILGTPIELEYSNPKYTILKKLGLQGVSDEDKQKIMKDFYVTPPKSTHTLSLQAYPDIQKIIKPLLIDLIHKQQPDIIIQKEAVLRDYSIPIQYEKKRNYGVSLSIELPAYLVNHASTLTIEANKISKGVEKGIIIINQDAPVNQEKQKQMAKIEAVASIIGDDTISVKNKFSGNKFFGKSLLSSDANDARKKETQEKQIANIATVASIIGDDTIELKSKLTDEAAALPIASMIEYKPDYVPEFDSKELQENLDYFKQPLSENDRKRKNPENEKQFELSFFTESEPAMFHKRLKTKDTHHMLYFMKRMLLKNGKRIPTGDKDGHINKENQLAMDYEADIYRAPHFSFITEPFTIALNETKRVTRTQWNDTIFPFLQTLPLYLAEMICSIHQGLYGPILGTFMHDTQYHSIEVYDSLFMVLPDKIIHHYSALYGEAFKQQDVDESNNNYGKRLTTFQENPRMEINPCIVECTFEIDRRTLNGYLQFDSYYVGKMVTSFMDANTTNFEIASRNAKIKVLQIMLKQMADRIKNTKSLISIISSKTNMSDPSKLDRNSMKNAFSEPLIGDFSIITQHELDTIRDIITILEPDTEKRAAKLQEIVDEFILGEETATLEEKKRQDILQKKQNDITSETNPDYLNRMEKELHILQKIRPITFNFQNKLNILTNIINTYFKTKGKSGKYTSNGTQSDKPYDYSEIDQLFATISSMFPPNVSSILPSEVDKKHEVYPYIYHKFMSELENIEDGYKKAYEEKQQINLAQNFVLTTLLSENKFNEVIDQITQSRAENAASWAPILSGYFRRRKIIGTIENRAELHKRIYEQTVDVAKSNMDCADAAAQYTLFHKMVNKMGMYLRDNNGIAYEEKQIDLSKVTCKIADKDMIFKEVEKAAAVVAQVIDTEIISSANKNRISSAVEAAVEVIMEAEEDIIELEEKTRIGVAIIAQQDLDKLEESDSESNGSNSESNSELPEQIQSQLNAIRDDIDREKAELKQLKQNFNQAVIEADKNLTKNPIRNAARRVVMNQQRKISALEADRRELERKLALLQKASGAKPAEPPVVQPAAQLEVNHRLLINFQNYYRKMLMKMIIDRHHHLKIIIITIIMCHHHHLKITIITIIMYHHRLLLYIHLRRLDDWHQKKLNE